MFERGCILKASGAALLLMAVLLIGTATAQSAYPLDVKPGDTIEIGQEEIVLELVDLRDQSTLNPITQLRQYKMDDPSMQVTKTIPVGDDTYVKINSHTLGGKYGRYYPYSAKDGVIKNSITFVEASATVTTQTATETATPTVEETQTTGETQTTVTVTEAETPTTTRAPLSPLGVIGALCIVGILAIARTLRE